MTAAAPATPAAARSRGRWIVPVLDALTEGSWIAVVDAAVATLAKTSPLGPLPFAVIAGLSLWWVRRGASPRTAMAGLAVLYAGGAAAAGLLGGVGVPTVDGSIGFAQVSAVLGAFAVFRGSRHIDILDDDLVVGGLLQWGFPLLALPWLYGASLEPADRDTFVATAFPATLLFTATGLLALGLARLDSLTSMSGVDWRRNRAWLALLGGVLVAMLVIAIPSAFLLGTPILLFFYGILGPIATILRPVGDALYAILVFLLGLLTPIIDFLQSLIHQVNPNHQQAPVGGSADVTPVIDDIGQANPIGLLVLGTIGVLIALGLFWLLLRLTYRPKSTSPSSDEVALVEREFRIPSPDLHLPRFHLPHRATRPTSASAAYVAFLADLAERPDLARAPDEPPATHAARLRAAGLTDLRADLLAADYQLERYALRPVGPRETARAVNRLRALKAVIARVPAPPPLPPQDEG
jgi:hypothetical protein